MALPTQGIAKRHPCAAAPVSYCLLSVLATHINRRTSNSQCISSALHKVITFKCKTSPRR
jgi:hypothetical protein